MQRYSGRNKKGLSTLSLIILLLIAAIFGGIISYLWVTGYYVSLQQNIPQQDTVAITNLYFDPENASAFNVTVLNPSYSPSSDVGVDAIGYEGASETTMHFVSSSEPTFFHYPISRGTSQIFKCIGDLAPYVNSTVRVSVFVTNGSGSTNFFKIPYTQLRIPTVDFNSTLGVKNFTITLTNDPQSAATLTVTQIGIDRPTQGFLNTTLHPITPALPLTLAPNKTVTLSIKDWQTYAALGGSHIVQAFTKEGYSAGPYNTTIPKVAFSVQHISFNETDTKHFTVTLRNNVSANTPLNVSKIQLIVGGGTPIDVTPPLNSHTNGVLGNSNKTFTVPWDWTNYRNTDVIVVVTMLQGVTAQGAQTTRPAAILSMVGAPTFPDSQHILVTVQNSPTYSTKAANVTRITVTLANGTERALSIVPTPPYVIPIGDETMFSASWDWTTYLNKTVTVNVYTNETLATSYKTTTPASLANYGIFLSIRLMPVFSSANTTQFKTTVQNNITSSGTATITSITVLLVNGTEVPASNFTIQAIVPGGNATFVCLWNWQTYRNKSLVVRVYTSDGLKAIYVTRTPP